MHVEQVTKSEKIHGGNVGLTFNRIRWWCRWEEKSGRISTFLFAP